MVSMWEGSDRRSLGEVSQGINKTQSFLTEDTRLGQTIDVSRRGSVVRATERTWTRGGGGWNKDVPVFLTNSNVTVLVRSNNKTLSKFRGTGYPWSRPDKDTSVLLIRGGEVYVVRSDGSGPQELSMNFLG